jgi:hypothetical protein
MIVSQTRIGKPPPCERAIAASPTIMRGEIRADHQKTGLAEKFQRRGDFMLH